MTKQKICPDWSIAVKRGGTKGIPPEEEGLQINENQ